MNLSIKPTSKSRPTAGTQAGFTLIEVMMAFALFTFLIAGIFKIADASFRLSSKVTVKGQQEMHVAAFFELLRINFSAMPGNGKMTMAIPNAVGSSGYNTEIVMKDYPLAFSWGGVAAGSEKVLLVSEKDPLGGTQIRVRYLNEEEAESHESGGIGDDEGESLVLIAGIKSMYWQFFDQTEEEWIEEWDEENRRPSLLELNIEFYSLAEPIRAVFWIPVVANPESVVRGAQQGATRTTTGNNGGNNNGGNAGDRRGGGGGAPQGGGGGR